MCCDLREACDCRSFCENDDGLSRHLTGAASRQARVTSFPLQTSLHVTFCGGIEPPTKKSIHLNLHPPIHSFFHPSPPRDTHTSTHPVTRSLTQLRFSSPHRDGLRLPGLPSIADGGAPALPSTVRMPAVPSILHLELQWQPRLAPLSSYRPPYSSSSSW